MESPSWLSPRISGSQFERPAGSSSLLFSCTGVDSLIYLAFHGLAESVLAQFMERNSIHGNLFHATVVELIAFAQEVGARLRIGNHRDHSVRRADDSIQPQRADLQAGFSGRQIFACAVVLAAVDEGLKWIAPRELLAFAWRLRIGGARRSLHGLSRRRFRFRFGGGLLRLLRGLRHRGGHGDPARGVSL